jgi:hypothetical protein
VSASLSLSARRWISKFWLHHEAEEYLDAYLETAAITEGDTPLF